MHFIGVAPLRTLRSGWFLLLCWLAPASADVIVDASYEEPVNRYGHFALGRPHEYARVVARTSGGRRAVLELPEDEVFEDLAPRLVRLEAGADPVLLTIVASRSGGGRLALLALEEGALTMRAQSPPIGTPNRWLNPVGVADLDGDGRGEVAAVITPHIGGRLTVYEVEGERMEPVTWESGFSNHLYGSADLDLSLPVSLDGAVRLVVPSQDLSQLHVMAYEGRALAELARCALASPVNGPLREVEAGTLEVTTIDGLERVALDGCAVR